MSQRHYQQHRVRTSLIDPTQFALVTVEIPTPDDGMSMRSHDSRSDKQWRSQRRQERKVVQQKGRGGALYLDDRGRWV